MAPMISVRTGEYRIRAANCSDVAFGMSALKPPCNYPWESCFFARISLFFNRPLELVLVLVLDLGTPHFKKRFEGQEKRVS
jgi:hypothetical protein